MSKLKAIITVGISASGKTTFAKSLDRTWVNVNRDDLRFTITGTSGWGEYKFNKSVESMVTNLQYRMVEEARNVGKNVIISDTNLNPKTLNMWQEFLEGLEYKVETKHFPVKLEEAWKRDSLRDNGVGHSVIYNQWLRYHHQYSYTYTPNELLPKAAVFDIDGTIARMVDRGPFEWHRVGEDEVRWDIAEYLNALKQNDYEIILLSGRDSCCRNQTEDWLERHEIPYKELFMRSEEDNRPDTEIKEELFKTHLAGEYNVQIVVDDRPCMIRTWHRIKIPTVMSVADPYIEF